MNRKRLGLLISGRGSNMAAILAAAGPDYPAEPVLVLSNRADAAGLEVAAARGVPTAVVESRAFKGDRTGFEAAMEAELARHGVEIIALAGFMRVLTPDFVRRWEGRLINIHPSLLPAFPGLDTHTEASLAARVLAEEHKLYPAALSWLAAGRVRLEAGRAVITPVESARDSLLNPLPRTALLSTQ
jgi:folate-dependent phosphoribosylglycinamide formyltransferase PurN